MAMRGGETSTSVGFLSSARVPNVHEKKSISSYSLATNTIQQINSI
jgi:hypothetical protein